MTLLTMPEAAEKLRVSVKTLRRRVHAGEIGYVRQPGQICFRPEHLEDYIRRHEHQPMTPRIPESARRSA